MGTASAGGAPLSPTEAQRWTRVGALCALSMLLGYLESFVPIPIPGVKLGLANIPVLVALAQHDLRGACWVAATKVAATGLLFGNPLTLAYSAAGTTLALALMCPLSLVPTLRLEMVSVVGALAHEAGQLAVAQLVLGTPLVWYSAPVLAVAGCVTGLLCGAAASATSALLREAERQATSSKPAFAPAPDAAPSPQAGLRLAAYLAFVAFALHARSLHALAGCVAAALVAAAVTRVPARTLVRSCAAMLPLAALTLAAQVASTQVGTVVATLGPVALTHEALVAAARMFARLVGISTASVAVVAGTGRSDLAQAARAVARPLEALGLDLRGPELALSTAVGLLPLLADLVQGNLRFRDLLRRSFWTQQLPQLVAKLYQQALR